MRQPYKWLAWIIGLLLIVSSCKDKTDHQPPHTEIVSVATDATKDSSLLLTYDSVGGGEVVSEAVIVVETLDTSSQLLSDVVYTSTELIPYTPPLDSLVDAIAMSQVGVREATGHNDGKAVEMYLKNVGLPKGNAWCAALVRWVFDQAGVRTTITAWSPTAFNPKNVVYSKGELKQAFRKGDVFTLYYPNLKRVGHTGFVRGKFGVNSVQTIEGNTNGQGSREGDGVYVKVRPRSSLYQVSRWF